MSAQLVANGAKHRASGDRVHYVNLPKTHLNLLEPAALVRNFIAHPPEGFVPLDTSVAGPAPSFAAPLDLLTAADHDFRRRLAELPRFEQWSRHLRVRAAFVGTTVSEYALFPPNANPAQMALGWRKRLAPFYRLLIVKDIPRNSPLLDANANAHADAVASACEHEGFVLVEGQALAYVQMDFTTTEAYVARLSPSRRKNLRRKLRSRAGIQIDRFPTGHARFASQETIDAYYHLYLDVVAKSQVHFDKLSREFFEAVLRDDSNGGIVFEYRHLGELIGWNLCFESDGKLIDKYIGFKYPQARLHNLYAVSWMVNLEYALERGLTHYIAGWAAPRSKARLGAQFTFTRHAVYVRNPWLRMLARSLVRWFDKDRRWHEGPG
jgi:hypothetical protein